MSDETLPALFGAPQALFYYGYVGFYFSSSPWFPVVVALVLVSRQAATDAFDNLFLLPFAVGLGSWVASLVGNATLLPTLVPHLAYIMRFEVTSKDKAESTDNDGEIVVDFDGRPYSFAVGPLLLLAGVLLFLSPTTNIGHTGVVLFGLGLVLIGFLYFVWALVQLCISGVRADAADARYLLYMLLYFILPTLYTLMARAARPYEGIAFLFALGLLTAFVVFVEIRSIGIDTLGPSVLLDNDARFVRAGRYTIGIARRWLLLLALPLALVYLVGWILDELFDGDVRATAIGVIVVAFVLAASTFCCCGRRPLITNGTALLTGGGVDDDGDALADVDEAQQGNGSGGTSATKRRPGKGVTLKKPKP